MELSSTAGGAQAPSSSPGLGSGPSPASGPGAAATADVGVTPAPAEVGRDDVAPSGAGMDGDAGIGSPELTGSSGPSADPWSGGIEGSAGCGSLAFPEPGEQRVEIRGASREFVVKLPRGYDPHRPYRLVFVWHPLGGTAAATAEHWYGLTQQAQDSAIFVAGQARGRRSRRWGLASWVFAPDESDVEYTRAMLAWVQAAYCVDPSRVFAFGDGNGGTMSNIVGCELGETFRAIAVSAGAGPETVATMPCRGRVAVWIVHGNRDTRVPFTYGQNSRNFWLRYNQCGETALTVEPSPCVEYQGCEEGYPVRFCAFEGGHVIPAFTAEAVWGFFLQF